MALIECPECKKEISMYASACPNCGLPKEFFSKVDNSIAVIEKPKNEPKKKRARHKLPNGYGYIKHLSGNRLHPYVAYPPTNEYTIKGNPKYKNALGYFKTYNEAYKTLIEYNENGKRVKRNIIFSEAYTLFIEEYEKTKNAQSTVASYKSAYKNLKPLHQMIMRDIVANDMQKIIDESDLGYSSKNNMVVLLHHVFNYCNKNDYIDKDYSKFIEIRQENDNESGIPFTEDDLKLMWKHKDEYEIRIMLILCYTGLRISELKITKINKETKIMKGGLKTDSGKKRIVPIIDAILPLFDVVDEFRKSTPSAFRKRLYPVLEKHGIYYVKDTTHTPHDCRHTFNWLCDKYKVDEIVKYMVIGHSLGNDVDKKIYTHRTEEEIINEISKIKVIK